MVKLFRGVFSRDEFGNTLNKPLINEMVILNLAKSNEEGTHWTAYVKRSNIVHFYNSFGAIRPPIELVKYLIKCKIYYNYEREQEYNTVICGQLCLCFLFTAYNKLFC